MLATVCLKTQRDIKPSEGVKSFWFKGTRFKVNSGGRTLYKSLDVRRQNIVGGIVFWGGKEEGEVIWLGSNTEQIE